MRAVLALLVGWGLALLGLAAPPSTFLWSGGWIFSLLGGLIAYWLLMRTEASVLSEAEYDAITEDEGEAARQRCMTNGYGCKKIERAARERHICL